MNKIDQVISIARRVRKWAERTNNRRVWPFNDDLCGMCAIASVKLFKELNAAGITNARICENDEHCFIIWHGYIIDVTATQFGFTNEPITVIKVKDVDSYYRFWKAKRVFKCVKKYVEHQRIHWPGDQRARC